MDKIEKIDEIKNVDIIEKKNKIENMDVIKNMDKIMRFRGTYLFQMFIILDMTPHNKIFIFFSGFFIILMRGKITFKIKKRSD